MIPRRVRGLVWQMKCRCGEWAGSYWYCTDIYPMLGLPLSSTTKFFWLELDA